MALNVIRGTAVSEDPSGFARNVARAEPRPTGAVALATFGIAARTGASPYPKISTSRANLFRTALHKNWSPSRSAALPIDSSC